MDTLTQDKTVSTLKPVETIENIEGVFEGMLPVTSVKKDSKHITCFYTIKGASVDAACIYTDYCKWKRHTGKIPNYCLYRPE